MRTGKEREGAVFGSAFLQRNPEAKCGWRIGVLRNYSDKGRSGGEKATYEERPESSVRKKLSDNFSEWSNIESARVVVFGNCGMNRSSGYQGAPSAFPLAFSSYMRLLRYHHGLKC